jgi:hypothetical protein
VSRKGEPAGSSAFRSLLHCLADEVALASERGMPIILPDPGTEHGRALYRTLGVEIEPPSPPEHEAH